MDSSFGLLDAFAFLVFAILIGVGVIIVVKLGQLPGQLASSIDKLGGCTCMAATAFPRAAPIAVSASDMVSPSAAKRRSSSARRLTFAPLSKPTGSNNLYGFFSPADPGVLFQKAIWLSPSGPAPVP